MQINKQKEKIENKRSFSFCLFSSAHGYCLSPAPSHLRSDISAQQLSTKHCLFPVSIIMYRLNFIYDVTINLEIVTAYKRTRISDRAAPQIHPHRLRPNGYEGNLTISRHPTDHKSPHPPIHWPTHFSIHPSSHPSSRPWIHPYNHLLIHIRP